MSTDWNDEYKAKVRAFMAEHGRKIVFREKDFDWQDEDDVSPYGYVDYAAAEHVFPASWHEKYPETYSEPCRWVVPEGAVLYERTYSMFAGTFTSNNDEHGVNVTGCRCACGKYEDVVLRWTGTVAQMLHSILGMPDQRIGVTL